MRVFARGFTRGLWALLRLLVLLLYIFKALADFFRNLCRACRRRRWPRAERGCCVDVPASVYRRPDPLIYSQPFLMAQGLAVTWDNPDIQLFDGDEAVASSSLAPDRDYTVRVQVWNNSYDAPAAGLGVSLSFLTFGIGTTPNFIGQQLIDLGVKASSQCPAFADFVWHTPQAEGHYCLQARLEWPDDANPDNNMGQENTDVRKLQSPASFTFPVANQAAIPRRFRLAADFYRLPKLRACPEAEDKVFTPAREREEPSRFEESLAHWETASKEQGKSSAPVPEDWTVTIAPSDFTLKAGEKISVQVTAEPKFSGFKGTEAINVNAYATAIGEGQVEFVGGVTLYVVGV
jgi:hypothetical protein